MDAKAPTFLIDGSDDPDTIFAGADGVALNADQDVDLTSIGTPPAWNILAAAATTSSSLAGGHGTGAPCTPAATGSAATPATTSSRAGTEPTS